MESRRHPTAASGPRRRTSWSFLSNHARVLACIADDPSIRLRDVAGQVGITERAAQSIVADLVASGCVTRTRIGRRNYYEIHRDVYLRDDASHDIVVGDLLDFLARRTVPVTLPTPASPEVATSGRWQVELDPGTDVAVAASSN